MMDEGLPKGRDHLVGEEPSSPEHGSNQASVEEAKVLTRTRARDLRQMLGRYVRRHMPPLPQKQGGVPEPPRVVGTHARRLPYLRLVPIPLVALIVVSFFWDFNGVAAAASVSSRSLLAVMRVISVIGLIGYITNWLAIAMLVVPRERRPIFGQGLIPAQRDSVIYRLARAVSDVVMYEQSIKEKIVE